MAKLSAFLLLAERGLSPDFRTGDFPASLRGLDVILGRLPSIMEAERPPSAASLLSSLSLLFRLPSLIFFLS